MRNAVDSVLAHGLRAHVAGEPLSAALGAAVEAEVRKRSTLAAFGGFPLTSPWTHWANAIDGASDQYARDVAVTSCFRWLVVTGAPRSDLARTVAQYIVAGLGTVDAVREALRARHDVRLLEAWCARGHRLYRPTEVWPYLAPDLRSTARVVLNAEKLVSITTWVHRRLTWVADQTRWNVVDQWQPPGLTLALATGDCEDFALVLWSALPLLALPEGQMVVGTWNGRGHAWLEVPELGLHADGVTGKVTVGRPAAYTPRLFISPSTCVSAG